MLSNAAGCALCRLCRTRAWTVLLALAVAGSGSAPDARAMPSLAIPASGWHILYVLRPGDTPARLARLYGDSVWLLTLRNPGPWQPGRRIVLGLWPFAPAQRVQALVQVDHPLTHTVAAGDTLWAIATAWGCAAAALAQENGLADPGTIIPGQTIVHHRYSLRRQVVRGGGLPEGGVPAIALLQASARYVGMDPALLAAVAQHESNMRMVRGASGERGIMQIMPALSRWADRTLVGYPLNPDRAADNVLQGAVILRYYLTLWHGDVRRALAYYHSGNLAVRSKRNAPYIRAVLALRGAFAARV